MLSPLRGLVALGLLAAALFGLGGASANASHTPDGQPADRDFVTGAWGSEDLEPQFVIFFDASSGPSGRNPTGTVTFVLDFGGIPDVSPAGYTVTCLKVSGNRAAVGGVLAYHQGGPPPPPSVVFYVEDGVDGAPDRTLINGLESSSPPTTCPDPLPAGHWALLPSRGRDLIVHDAVEPVPSSKDQCRNGGWRNYPQFKNVGQCVAFVNHGP